jgi:hypothetical protein
MASLQQILLEHLPLKRRQNNKGWITFDSPCCHHRGHNPDRRSRGNCLINADGTVIYNCYTCGYKTGFDGTHLGLKFESLLRWLGVSSDHLTSIKLEILKNQLDGIDSNEHSQEIFRLPTFKEIPLPPHSHPIDEISQWEDPPEQYLKVLDYLVNRGDAICSNYSFYWSSSHKNDMCDRLIIPFYHRNKIVGWTARYAGDIPSPSTPRYFNSELQSGYIFNDLAMHRSERYSVILVEGPFDAIAVDGIGALGSKLSREQIAHIECSGKEIVLLPDRQKKNQDLIDIAIERGWYVSFPEWEDDIKDAADAAKRYGRIYTVRSTLASKTNSHLEINLKRQMFRN